MEENKKKKLKNKKKDVISFGSDTVVTTADSAKPATDLKEKPSPSTHIIGQEKFTLPLTKNTTFITDKILFQIQLLLSSGIKVDQILGKIFASLISREHFHNILLERECNEVCGNFFCTNEIEKVPKKSKLKYNKIKGTFSKEDLFDYFCCEECFETFRKLAIDSQDRFDYLRLLSLDVVFLLRHIQDYYEQNKYLERISDLAENILGEYLRGNKETNFENFFRRERTKISKIFIKDFSTVINDSEFNNEEDKKILKDLFNLE